MYKDYIGNRIAVGDTVFLIKAFVEKHFAQEDPLEDDSEFVDEELEQARRDYELNGFQELERENATDIENQIVDTSPQKRYREKDFQKNEPSAIDYSDIDLQKNDRVEILKGVSSGAVPFGRIVFIEPSKSDKIIQLKDTINKLLQAENNNIQSIQIDDFLFTGQIDQQNFESEILNRTKLLNNISSEYKRPEKRGTVAYIQLENKEGNKYKALLSSIIARIERTTTDQIVVDITQDKIFELAEKYRSNLPYFLQNISSEEIYKLYPTSIISYFFDKVTFEAEQIGSKTYHSLISPYKSFQALDLIFDKITQSGKTFSEDNIEEMEKLCKKIINSYIDKDIEYKKMFKFFSVKEYLKYRRAKMNILKNNYMDNSEIPNSMSSNLKRLHPSEKGDYISLLEYIINSFKYKDGLYPYNLDEISKVAFTKNINTTINKLALNIEQWFIYNEGKLLKSIFG